MKSLILFNDLFVLKGMPALRHFPYLNKLPGVRGLAKISDIDFPDTDQQKLKAVTGRNKATFFLPNHPEFFTDWMIDKYLLSRISPHAACWAAGSIVNGMGSLMQRFWLNNNLIAQIPGQSQQGKAYSVKAALAGNGVLLHPEGQVNWCGNRISPLFPGAADMAIKSYQQGVDANKSFQSWLAPVVWKFRFNDNLKKQLLKECNYVERRLNLSQSRCDCAAVRVYNIYLKLAWRDYKQISGLDDLFADSHLYELRNKIIEKAIQQLRKIMITDNSDQNRVVQSAKKWLLENHATHSHFVRVENALRLYQRWSKLDEYVFSRIEITQEEIAEHLKRLRAEFCKGSLKDTVNYFIPQAAGMRTVHIRAVKPLAIHEMCIGNLTLNPTQIMVAIRRSMQNALDLLLDETEKFCPGIKVLNPFYVCPVLADSSALKL